MNYLNKNKEQYIKDLRGLIEIESYLEDPKKYPNDNMLKAVEYMAKLGNDEGFKTFVEPNGYYGYIEMGEGTEMIGILGHLDVVPPGKDSSKWDTPAFELTIDDDLLKGRGTQDDKAPVLLGFYLMKEIKESGIKLNKRIRLIFPTDEESFWRGVDKYKEDKQEIPTHGFTPDSVFPVTYSERELWEFKIIGNATNEFELEAGGAINVVPDHAKYKKENESIETVGKAAHAMEPHKGENAIYTMIEKIDTRHELISFIKNEILNETNGQKLFNRVFKDDDSELTVNLATAYINQDKAEVTLDLRIPNTTNSMELERILLEKLKSYPTLKYEFYDELPGVYLPKDSKIVKTFMKSYQEVTGDNDSKPMASGGATYARAMDNIVAFGPFFADSPNSEHQYNEHVRWQDLEKAYDIYEYAMKELLN